jgi:hypothetical protein
MIPDPFVRDRCGADPLIEGFYLIQSSRGKRVDVPVHVWFGGPLDPETGEELDRSPRWQIQIGFQLLEEVPMRVGAVWINDITDVWPMCMRWPIEEAEYRYRLERASWAGNYDPMDPHGEIGGRIDPMTCRLP